MLIEGPNAEYLWGIWIGVVDHGAAGSAIQSRGVASGEVAENWVERVDAGPLGGFLQDRGVRHCRST